jgi:GMP synthase-like glutamine amidotransferase
MSVIEAPTPKITRRWKLTGAPVIATRPDSAVLIQKGEHTSAGLLLDVLSDRGLDSTSVRVDLGEILPAVDSVSFAVLLGANELTDELDPRVIRWVAEADAAGVAIFAIGTGAHALARALGGDSVPAPRSERGWISVTSADPELLSTGPWFAWNDRTLSLPAGAQLLAESHSGPQAFRIGRHVGVQFHPEVTPELVREWVPTSRQLLDSQGINEATVRDFPVAKLAAQKLFTAFIDGALAAA